MQKKRWSFLIKLLLGLAIVLFGCDEDKKNSAIKINGEDVYTNEIDGLIQDQLYEALYEIYYLRKITADELIATRVLELESKNRGISKDYLLEIEIERKKSNSGLQKFVAENNLEQGIPDKLNPLNLISIHSEEGREYLDKIYSQSLTEQLIDSLRIKYNVEVLLTPPQSPKIRLYDIYGHSKGFSDSPLKITLISDLNCLKCREFYPKFKVLMTKYQKNAEFKFINFSPYLSNNIIACEAAAEQGKFWEMLDLVAPNIVKDTSNYMSYAASIGCDTLKFRKFVNHSNELESKFKMLFDGLTRRKIKSTPTLLINDRVYHGRLDLVYLTQFIDDLIED